MTSIVKKNANPQDLAKIFWDYVARQCKDTHEDKVNLLHEFKDKPELDIISEELIYLISCVVDYGLFLNLNDSPERDIVWDSYVEYIREFGVASRDLGSFVTRFRERYETYAELMDEASPKDIGKVFARFSGQEDHIIVVELAAIEFVGALEYINSIFDEFTVSCS